MEFNNNLVSLGNCNGDDAMKSPSSNEAYIEDGFYGFLMAFENDETLIVFLLATKRRGPLYPHTQQLTFEEGPASPNRRFPAPSLCALVGWVRGDPTGGW